MFDSLGSAHAALIIYTAAIAIGNTFFMVKVLLLWVNAAPAANTDQIYQITRHYHFEKEHNFLKK